MASPPDLDGPRLAPLSGGPARQLVVLVHGYGSNGADLISLAPMWQQALPDAAFVAPNGPQRCPWGMGAYQWWALGNLSPAGLAAGALGAAPALDRFLDAELARTGLDEERLVLVGFSQGTMMALHVAPRRARQVAGVIGYSGLLADAGALASEVRTKPPVLLIHGSADPMVPVAALHASAHALEALGFAVEAHVRPGLGHSVDAEGVTLGAAFARRVLGVGRSGAMTVSAFELFKVGVGPSSSHTMGPMTAARRFVTALADAGALARTGRVVVELYGSLALTGKGHATDRAVLLGLAGFAPETLEPEAAENAAAAIRAGGRLALADTREIAFDEARDLLFHQRERLPFHSNGIRCTAFDADGGTIDTRVYYSVGGGAVVDEAAVAANAPPGALADVPYPYRSGDELLAIAEREGLTIAGLVLANEVALRPEADVRAGLAHIAAVMGACIERGMGSGGILPGGLNVKRRAPGIHAALLARQERALSDPLSVIDWVNLWALAVNEENAAGGRVVTAPTNGAAGIVPAVLRYYQRFVPGATQAGVVDFLLVATAVGSLFKENASISGAEVGCQGEVGVACSMAAAGLTAVQGGSNAQIENAAEIGMEHNLGLTCDPVGGLVQVPCIERNAVGAIKAIEASRLALLGDGTHRVSLDQVIETMRKTGADMNERYKETSLGGLAVNVVEC